jgi:antitoxin component of MazEF toxin-antitoxin module
VTHIRNLLRNGSSVCVTLPKPYLDHLAWDTGKQIAVELLADGTIWLRAPNERDYNQRAVVARTPPAPVLELR